MVLDKVAVTEPVKVVRAQGPANQNRLASPRRHFPLLVRLSLRSSSFSSGFAFGNTSGAPTPEHTGSVEDPFDLQSWIDGKMHWIPF